MAAKRALVVDDSKSARAFLSSLLEKHHLEVDTAESAEDAIEYLTRHRPDVIFMDHLMPGMDGFQAVQAIKTNPRTATIPILMYTSQEGELYLGQARALGAIGVLPKQIAPADVTKVLHQLRLAEDRRVPGETGAFIPVADADANAETVIAPRPQAAPPGGADLLVHAAHAPVTPDVLLRDQVAELRRFLVTSMDEQAERILDDVRLMLRDFPRDAPA
ncbi:MAG: response regulator, partial [Pseudomonadota bacterium]